jgi:hypothetical protein
LKDFATAVVALEATVSAHATSINRAQGAAAAGNTFWEYNQLSAAANFALQASKLETRLSGLASQLGPLGLFKNAATIHAAFFDLAAISLVQATDDLSEATQIRVNQIGVSPMSSGYGSGHDAFVTTLYIEILARAPGPAGLSYWSRHLAHAAKPKTVALAIWRSREHRMLVNQHLAPPTTFHRSFADAIRAARDAKAKNRSEKPGHGETGKTGT